LKSCKSCTYYFKTEFGFERCKVNAVKLNHANVFALCEEMKKTKCGKDAALFVPKDSVPAKENRHTQAS